MVYLSRVEAAVVYEFVEVELNALSVVPAFLGGAQELLQKLLEANFDLVRPLALLGALLHRNAELAPSPFVLFLLHVVGILLVYELDRYVEKRLFLLYEAVEHYRIVDERVDCEVVGDYDAVLVNIGGKIAGSPENALHDLPKAPWTVNRSI